MRYQIVTLKEQDSLARYISICKKLARWRLIAGTISITVSDYSDEEKEELLGKEEIEVILFEFSGLISNFTTKNSLVTDFRRKDRFAKR